MSSPFYKIYIENNNRDISDVIERFHYEDCMEEDSYLELVVNKEESMNYADDPDLVEGTWLCFQFGYLEGEISKLHRCRITDIKTRYSDKVTLTIKCLDIGTSVRKDTEQKIWKNKTSVEIAKEIADKWGLTLEADKTSKVWKSVPQGNMSDMNFLKYLADREDSGNYVVYIRNTSLHFVKRKLDESSKKTYTYGDGDGSVISFEPEWRESSQDISANEVKTSKVDLKSTSVVSSKVNNDNETKTGTLGETKVKFSGMFKYKGKVNTKSSAAPKAAKQMITPTRDTTEAENLANAKKKKSTLKQLVAGLTVEGDPNINPNSVITISGVAKNHSGNWFVIKVVHDITNSGYITKMDLNKNGTNKGSSKKSSTSTKAKDSNKSVGPKKADSTVKVVRFDGMFRKKN